MKVHTGVDAGTGCVHTVTATPANIHDVEETTKLVQDDEVLYGDSEYLGAQKRIDKDKSLANIECRINKRPSSIKMNAEYSGYQWDREIENRKSSVRSKVEHPFLIVKKQFGYCRTVYHGLAKNLNRFQVLFASADLLMRIRVGRTPDFVTG